MGSQIFVIGHVNPDTDSIASAVGYAWLLKERDGSDTVAARAGAINSQTSWILKLLKLDPPLLITDASPRFESVVRRLDTTTLDSPLRDAWAIATRTGGIAPVLDHEGSPYGLITGNSLFNYMGKLVGVTPRQQDIGISKILDQPCKDAAATNILKFNINIKIRDVVTRILREEGDEFWVVDEKGHYVGICRQRDLLNPPRLKFVLVDHNEKQQSVASLEEAQLIEILDHHRLGNPTTHLPIRMSVDVVGSTSTLVSERMEESGFSAPPQISGLLLAGLLSDTLNLTSPTTTDRDIKAAERLSRWAFVKGSPLESETRLSFGKKVLSASAGLSNRTPQDVVSSDMKIYSAGDFDFLIAQAEVSDLNEVNEHLPLLQAALEQLRQAKKMNFAMLMITDVVRGSSRIIISNPPAILEELPYLPQSDNSRLAEGVVSRKKQLLPVVLGLLED
ncbi:MAG: DHH family phosphoesterase [Chloroflexi bacterium]|nr:DHH family phosphoesterase [Chloroflexota bacterium]